MLRYLYDELLTLKVTLEEWYVYHDNVIEHREQLMSTYCWFIVPNVAGFFFNYYHFATLAKFYVIHKINKTPKVGRPLLSFTRKSLGLLVYLLIRLSNLKYKCLLCLEILPSWSKYWRTSRTSFFLGEGGGGGTYLKGAVIPNFEP